MYKNMSETLYVKRLAKKNKKVFTKKHLFTTIKKIKHFIKSIFIHERPRGFI